MKKLVIACAVVLMFFPDAAAQLGARRPWTWSLEDRIAARLDSDKIVQRLVEYERADGATNARAVASHSSITEKATFVIDGSKNPELFLPWELLERFLNSVSPATAGVESMRRYYAGHIQAFGWERDVFWSNVEEAARAYENARAEALRLQQPPESSRPRVRDRDATERARRKRFVVHDQTRSNDCARSSVPKRSTAFCTRPSRRT